MKTNKKKSINDLDAQYCRILHFGTYDQEQKAIQAVNIYRRNIFNYLGVEFINNRLYINGRELTAKEEVKIYKRKISAKVYAA